MQLIRANRDAILKPLQVVSGIVERRHTLPILANILIRKQGDEVSFLGTDIEIQIRTAAQLAAGGEDAATTVSARKLLDILRALPEGEVAMDLAAKRLTVKAGKSRFALQTLGAEEFPTVAVAEQWAASLSMPQRRLKHLFQMVHFSMAQQDIRYYLNGLLWVVEGTRVRVVATDGHRLAYAATDLAEPGPDAEADGGEAAAPPAPPAVTSRIEVIVPRKTVLELQRLLDDSDEPVAIDVAANQIRFRFGSVELVSKLIEGKFPDYQRVIPTGYKREVHLARPVLAGSLARAAILTSDKFKGVRFTLAPGTLRIQVTNAEQEEAVEEIDVDFGGDPIEIGFNVAYLLDALNNLKSEQVTLQFGDANSSALLTVPGDDSFKYVVMPMADLIRSGDAGCGHSALQEQRVLGLDAQPQLAAAHLVEVVQVARLAAGQQQAVVAQRVGAHPGVEIGQRAVGLREIGRQPPEELGHHHQALQRRQPLDRAAPPNADVLGAEDAQLRGPGLGRDRARAQHQLEGLRLVEGRVGQPLAQQRDVGRALHLVGLQPHALAVGPRAGAGMHVGDQPAVGLDAAGQHVAGQLVLGGLDHRAARVEAHAPEAQQREQPVARPLRQRVRLADFAGRALQAAGDRVVRLERIDRLEPQRHDARGRHARRALGESRQREGAVAVVQHEPHRVAVGPGLRAGAGVAQPEAAGEQGVAAGGGHGGRLRSGGGVGGVGGAGGVGGRQSVPRSPSRKPRPGSGATSLIGLACTRASTSSRLVPRTNASSERAPGETRQLAKASRNV
jgi:DNA polymerase-3 subunit beta